MSWNVKVLYKIIFVFTLIYSQTGLFLSRVKLINDVPQAAKHTVHQSKNKKK